MTAMASASGTIERPAGSHADQRPLGELDRLRLRLRTIEAEYEDERLRTRSRALFVGLIALVVLVSFASTWLARSLGYDLVRFTGIAIQLSLAITILAAAAVAVAVVMQLREAEQRRLDHKRLLALENSLALKATNDISE